MGEFGFSSFAQSD